METFLEIDRFVLAIVTPLALAILVSGLDDLVIDIAWVGGWLKAKLRPKARMFPPGPRQLEAAPRARIAIFVPLWKEDAVIAKMLEHNLASIRYPDYHFFAGCYPNDDATQAAVRNVAARFPNVHLAVCPHDGPTSKADCLNWIYQHMLLHEEQTKQRYEIVVIHDAEDLVHPEELRWVNYYAARYDFVQTPVLALKTPQWELTHGVYIDEFAEYHTRDMTVRAVLGGFVPSCGVGTGFRRDALERLAEAWANRVFEPEALTEDYDVGLRLKRLGCTQAFVPILKHGAGDFVATREYFPRNFRAALRQRVRWTMGISLQSWQKFGWRGSIGEVYWMWRDRKGLLANPLSVLANLVALYGVVTGAWLRASPLAMQLAEITFGLLCFRTFVRMGCVTRVYGVSMALGVPVRAVYANVLNSAATIEAVRRYTWARLRRRPLKWLKTEHAYPHRDVLLSHKRRLGELLTSAGYIDGGVLELLVANCPPGVKLGTYLVNTGHLEVDALYEVLSFQQGLPVVRIDQREVRVEVARSLPEHAIRNWQVLPFRVAEGALFVASPDAPAAGLARELSAFTSLELRFHLVPPKEFDALTSALL